MASDGSSAAAGPCDTCVSTCLMFPPVRAAMKASRVCCLTPAQRELLAQTDDLFAKVNPDTNDSTCSAYCSMETLGKAEVMLLLRIIRDEKRSELAQYRSLLDDFSRGLKLASKKESDGGTQVTNDEFSEALISAINKYMKEANDKISKGIAAEYQAMDRDLESIEIEPGEKKLDAIETA